MSGSSGPRKVVKPGKKKRRQKRNKRELDGDDLFDDPNETYDFVTSPSPDTPNPRVLTSDSTQVRQPPPLPPRLMNVSPPDDPVSPHVTNPAQTRLPPPLPLAFSTTSSLDPDIVPVPQSSERLTEFMTLIDQVDTQYSSKHSMMFSNSF